MIVKSQFLVHPTIQPFIASISYQNRIERRTHLTNAIPPCIYYSTTLQLRKYQRLLRLFSEPSKQHPPIVYISLKESLFAEKIDQLNHQPQNVFNNPEFLRSEMIFRPKWSLWQGLLITFLLHM